MRLALVAAAIVLCTASSVRAQQPNLPLVDDLTGKGWTIKNGNGSMTLDASVPGYALEALQAAGKAGNPLDRCGLHTRHGTGHGASRAGHCKAGALRCVTPSYTWVLGQAVFRIRLESI